MRKDVWGIQYSYWRFLSFALTVLPFKNEAFFDNRGYGKGKVIKQPRKAITPTTLFYLILEFKTSQKEPKYPCFFSFTRNTYDKKDEKDLWVKSPYKSLKSVQINILWYLCSGFFYPGQSTMVRFGTGKGHEMGEYLI